MKYSVIMAFFRVFLFTHIFPTLIISNAGVDRPGNRIEPVEIVTDRIITSSDNLLQLEIELVKSERTVYPHL